MAKNSKKQDQPGEEPGFEETLEQLEAVVERLGEGDLLLEESLSVFEDGIRLSRQCAKQLDSVEKRIEVLTREGTEWKVSPLDSDTEDED